MSLRAPAYRGVVISFHLPEVASALACLTKITGIVSGLVRLNIAELSQAG